MECFTELCRACMEQPFDKRVPLTEDLIQPFKLFTDLEVNMNDGLPQQLCTVCSNTVHSFVEFRQMCISTSLALLQIQSSRDLPIESKNILKTELHVEENYQYETEEFLSDSHQFSDDKPFLNKLEDKIKQEIIDNEDWNAEENVTLSQILNKDHNRRGRPKKVKSEKRKLSSKGIKIKKLKRSHGNEFICGLCPEQFTEEEALWSHLESHNENLSCTLCMKQCEDFAQLVAHRIQHIPKQTSYKCHLCSKNYRTQSYLEMHIRATHLGGKETQCTLCSKTFTKPKNLSQHMANAHLGLELACSYCPKVLKSTQALKYHIGSHTSINKAVCDSCGKSFRSHFKLKIHIAKVHLKIGGDCETECGLCPATFDKEDLLWKHIATHQTETACEMCGESCYDWPQLAAHRLRHIKKLKNYKCYVCQKLFRQEPYLEYHIRTVHFGGSNILCKLCGRPYSNPRKLSKHVNVIHATPTIQCPHCPKKVKTRQALRVHIGVHSDLKRYVCDNCGVKFKSETALKFHIASRHLPNSRVCFHCYKIFYDVASYETHSTQCKNNVEVVCPQCGKLISNKRMLARHVSSQHGKARLYPCERCPKIFKAPGGLRAHRDRHDNNPRHKCSFCPAVFFSPSVLVKHKRVHTGERPYVCGVCGKGFTGRHNLKVHMKVHGELLVVKRELKAENLTLSL